MGVTIHYRGTIDDISQVEAMEDRLLDLVFALGGKATIWRSFADHDSSRVVRGLLAELGPGQETFSLLISPEGHLTPLFQIEDAENAPFDKPPFCFVKTQLGSLHGHVAIVHLLDALKQRFCSNLRISDEGDYYETRDINRLHQQRRMVQSAMESLTEGLQEYGLNREAAEDPNILASRIERIAALVQQKIPADREPPEVVTEDEGDGNWNEPSLEEEVENMDRLRRKNDLRNERMSRRIAEATAAGHSIEDAFELAMNEEGLSIPKDEADAQMESVPEEPWAESLPLYPFEEATSRSRRGHHPAVEQAQEFLIQVMNLEKDEPIKSSYYSILSRASMDIVGGLVQATCDESDDIINRALTITQLKRTLTAHAYARGAIFGLRGDMAITKDVSKQLHDQLESLLAIIHDMLEAAWTHGH
jgi:hypothetical protein